MADSDRTDRSGLRDALIRHRALVSLLIHVLLFSIAFFFAFGLRFNFANFNRWFVPYFLHFLPAMALIKTIVFWRMKLFRGTWRYVGMRDLWSITMATHLSVFCFVVLYFITVNSTTLLEYIRDTYPWAPSKFPDSVFLLDWGTTIGFVCGARLLVRLYHEEIRQVTSAGSRQCLILGAGDTGEALLREILRMRVERYRIVGFLDNDPAKQGTQIHGVPVLGRIAEARSFCERHQIEELLLALPGASQKALRSIVEQCAGMNVLFRTIPAMEAVIEGTVKVSQIRDVNIKDVLGRAQVRLDEAGIRDYIHGEKVLVTGAGGSIGSELCRQISRYRPGKLVLVEQAENNLFEIDRDLQRLFPNMPRVCFVADICDAKRIDRILRVERPALIFHAAAHKHVPMMESNVGEAVKNNILGTQTMADAAKEHAVQRFVMISTDKAVNPTSVMGCTKRVAEMYIQQLRAGSATQFMTVRFGNVLGSSGSVIPIFTKQIASGGPVTVTDPGMTRYFMTIPEASQLVLQAGVMGKDGDIFVLDMGEPVKIVDLARQMITLSGLRPGEDIEIQFTGIRPGEKLYEELSVAGENMGKTTHDKIYVWRNKKEDWPRVRRLMEDLIAHADDQDPGELRRGLMGIVPEFRPETETYDKRSEPTSAPSADPDSAAAPNHVGPLRVGESPAT